jgi:hypothetical protein
LGVQQMLGLVKNSTQPTPAPRTGKLPRRRAAQSHRAGDSFNDLVGAGEHGRRHVEAERLSGCQIDN